MVLQTHKQNKRATTKKNTKRSKSRCNVKNATQIHNEFDIYTVPVYMCACIYLCVAKMMKFFTNIDWE